MLRNDERYLKNISINLKNLKKHFKKLQKHQYGLDYLFNQHNEALRSESQILRSESQMLRSKSWILRNKSQIFRNESQALRGDHRRVYTEEVNKIALNSNNDKRIQTFDKFTTFPYGTNIFKVCESEMQSKNKLIEPDKDIDISKTADIDIDQ